MSERVDLAILGAGCAGLALGARLPHDKTRVLMLEPRVSYSHDRTWCFWARPIHELSDLVSCRWNRWHIGSGDAQTRYQHASEALPYQCIPADRYYNWALARCAANPAIKLATGISVQAVHREADGFRVDTSAGPVLARQVVDTRPSRNAHGDEPLLEQVFAGCEIQVQGYPTDSAGVMEQLRADAQGLLFDYVLPLAEDRVLVEATRFAAPGLALDVLQRDLEAALAQRGWSGATVLRRETGRLPMGLPARHKQTSGWVQAGISGGGLRASSGYGFLRIQSWARQCSEQYARSGQVMGHPDEPRWRHWMDLTFLRALKARPEQAPQMFAKIAGALNGDGFARFMSDGARPQDWLRVVAALPPALLIRAALT